MHTPMITRIMARGCNAIEAVWTMGEDWAEYRYEALFNEWGTGVWETVPCEDTSHLFSSLKTGTSYAVTVRAIHRESGKVTLYSNMAEVSTEP